MDDQDRAPDDARPAGTRPAEEPDDRSEDAADARNTPSDRLADDERPKSAVHVATEGESWLDAGVDRELTPGSPALESVAFVLLGVVVTLAVIAQFVI